MFSAASPIEPIIHSRPIVGVPNRVRIIDGMPEIIDKLMPMMPAIRVMIEMPKPSNKNNEPTTRQTVAITDHAWATPVCTSTAYPSMAITSRARAQGRVGNTVRP